ncbi:hypothetical protein DV702_04985 [Sporosarcina sp. PTS2304]|nr:hypothetical protein DV702_04985 [Sporosarcina sp. PTS2304]
MDIEVRLTGSVLRLTLLDDTLSGGDAVDRQALRVTPVKCKDVLLLAALHSQKPSFATAFPEPLGVDRL